jgi:hypothetical protein
MVVTVVKLVAEMFVRMVMTGKTPGSIEISGENVNITKDSVYVRFGGTASMRTISTLAADSLPIKVLLAHTVG